MVFFLDGLCLFCELGLVLVEGWWFRFGLLYFLLLVCCCCLFYVFLVSCLWLSTILVCGAVSMLNMIIMMMSRHVSLEASSQEDEI